MPRYCLPLAAVLLGAAAAPAAEKEPFELKDGDRVVLIGGTLIEREQSYGYWETALTARYPDRNVTFRNLGWSGDTVWGESRGSFDPPAVGYKRLVEGTLALKPTVIIVGYGTNESFAGEAGLEKFKQQYNKLLDDLAPAKARFVLLAPILMENHGHPLPDPTRMNQELRNYGRAIGEIAQGRGARFVDLWKWVARWRRGDGSKTPLTDNGVHLTAFGYWYTVIVWYRELDWPEPDSDAPFKLSGRGPHKRASARLLQPLFPTQGEPMLGEAEFCAVTDLPPAERFTLYIDKHKIATNSGGEWGTGKLLASGPDFDQVEQLRRKIVEKNREYFHRWRPQNETYLFGFRKYEQGKNAAEVPLFEPIVVELEKEIAKLRVPVEHTYELVPAK